MAINNNFLIFFLDLSYTLFSGCSENFYKTRVDELYTEAGLSRPLAFLAFDNCCSFQGTIFPWW